MGDGRGPAPDGGRGWSVRAGVRWRLAPRSIRWRLTLIYSALFMAAGAALLGFTYLLASRAAPSTAAGGSSAGSGLPGIDGGTPDPPTLTMYAEALRADQLHQLLVEAGIALAVMTFASVALGWLMAGRVLAPLRTMTAAARRISADNLRQRLAMPGPEDELKAMADTFDDVLGRLEGAFEAQKQFVANASHELRTPLTLQQAIVDVALADPGASVESLRAACLRVRAAGQEQERLIEALLTLARSQGGLRRREFIDLADLVGEHLQDGSVMEGGSHDAGAGAGVARPQEDDESGPRATGTGTGDNGNGGTGTGASELSRTGNGEPVTAGPGDGRTEPVRTEPVKTGNAGPEDTLPHVRAALRSAPLLGDPQLIERLVVNLTDNAVRHNNHGDGERWVRLWTGAEAGCPVLRIDNSGPVIPREQVAGLFQPFRRLGADRTVPSRAAGAGPGTVWGSGCPSSRPSPPPTAARSRRGPVRGAACRCG
ncbi:histidine kinase dimerization/phospho-acceptor domain-containing protein [Streptomyces aureus]|uniref:histidine kinase dimerization/phospho-acceptor domain-containing protein n=1 Tax=Streptomyces aureus TaxID=193461 RepID=UPI003689ABC4